MAAKILCLCQPVGNLRAHPLHVPAVVDRPAALGELAGYVGAAFLVAMAAFNSGFIDTGAGVPGSADGDDVLLRRRPIRNATPYSAEVFPVELLGRGAGLVQACNGIGKILGPLVLAVIAGARQPRDAEGDVGSDTAGVPGAGRLCRRGRTLFSHSSRSIACKCLCRYAPRGCPDRVADRKPVRSAGEERQ